MEAITILPVLAASLVIILIVVKLYQLIRVKLPKKVNCWFCNKNTRVPYKYKESWKCPSCEQYNGFAPDGGYNRVLPAQHNAFLNKPVYLKPTKKLSPAVNGLCRFCNINQELKVAQLAAFVPVEPSNFDEEIDVYTEQLDKAYRLCTKCDNVLTEKLSKQKSWLENLYQDFESFLYQKSEPLKKITSRRFFYTYTTAIVSAGLFVSAALHFQLSKEIFSYAVSYSQLVTASIQLPEIILFDILAVWDEIYPWLVGLDNVSLLLTGIASVIQLLEAFEQKDIPSGLSVVTWLILTALSALAKQKYGLISIVEMLAGGVSFVVSMITIKELKLERLRELQSLKRTLSDSSVHILPPLSETKTDRSKSPSVPNPKISQSVKNSRYIGSNSFVTNPNPKVSQSFMNANILQNSPKTPYPEDLGMGKLNLGAKRNQKKQLSPFETRSYGNGIPNNLFRPVLTPPKLSVDNLYPDIQTRSSSYSSGFGSSVSQHCDTRPPSVIGDFDTVSNDGCSVPPYPSPCNSLFQYPVDSMYPFPYVHFAAQYHRMYHPIPTPALMNSSYNSSNSDSVFGFIKSTLYSLPITLLVLSNLALVWIVVYKEFVVR